jgi:hypothetical protein
MQHKPNLNTMKIKYPILFLCLFLFYETLAQINPTSFSEKLDSIVFTKVVAHGSEGFTSYWYDVHGRIALARSHQGTNSTTPLTSEISYHYNSNGLLDSSVTIPHVQASVQKTVIHYFYSGTAIDSTSRVVYLAGTSGSSGLSVKYEYSATGELLSETTYSRPAGLPFYSVTRKRVWTYNIQNKLLADTIYVSDNQGELGVYQYAEYTHDFFTGLLQRKLIKTSGGYDYEQYWYTHNPQGDLIFEEFQVLEMGAFEPFLATGWGYDSLSNITDITYYSWQPFAFFWEPGHSYRAFYDTGLVSNTALPDLAFHEPFFRHNRPTHVHHVDTNPTYSALRTVITYHYSSSADMSIQPEPLSGDISLFPNPTSDYLYLELTSGNHPEYQILITDIQGREWKRLQLPANESARKIEVNTLPSGVYLLHISGNQVDVTRKFLINR